MENLDILTWPYVVDKESLVLHLDIEMEPASKARARIGRGGHFYTPRKTSDYEQNLALLMKTHRTSSDMSGAFGLRAIFNRSGRQRIDCDNLLKAVSDAANGVLWEDDSQVQEIVAKVFRDSGKPRLRVLVHRVKDNLPYYTCPTCGKQFHKPKSQARQTKTLNFCSTRCAGIAQRGERVMVTCRCGKEFEINASRLKWVKNPACSRACNLRYWKAKRDAGKGPAFWKCHTCGGPVSRKEYIRCKACFHAEKMAS